jgi:hypothetical protein
MSLINDPHSRFKLTESIYNNGMETIGIMKKHFFLDQANLSDDDIIKVTITPELAGKPWQIANKYYNSPVLDWVVVLFNKPLNPINWPHIGTVIKIPVQNVVLPNV